MKFKKISVALALILLATSLSPFKSVLAEGEKNVLLTSMPASEIAATWDNSAGGSSWTNEGAKVVLPGGVPEAWNRTGNILKSNTYRPIFNIANDRVVSFEFKIGLFDSLGNTISKSNNSFALDVHIMNAANDWELSLLRIFTDTGGALNGSHAWEIYPNAGQWGTKVASGTWIKGDATLSSSFFVQFSKADWFESYIGGSDDLTRLDTGDILKNSHANRFDGIDEIYFRIGGDNGFTANTEIIVTSINGQSLTNDGVNFVDTVAPLLIGSAASAIIPANEQYTLPITGYDLFGNNVSYEIYDGANKISNNRSFTPTAAGNLDVTLKALDSVGNVAEKQYSFTITLVIDAPVLQDVPTISDQTLAFYDKLEIPFPRVVEGTGTYTLKAYVYHESDLVNPLYTLSSSSEVTKNIKVLPNFIDGNYKVVYEVANAGGNVVSEPVSFNITLSTIVTVPWIQTNNELGIADYVSNGVRLRTHAYNKFKLGTFDLRDPFEITFNVPASSSYLPNDGLNGFVELAIYDLANENNFMWFRVWVSNDGADNPTNIFIGYDGQATLDITDAGWISNSVDDLTKSYRMGFSLEDMFYAMRTGGMTQTSTGVSQAETWIEAMGKTKFGVALQTYTLADKNYFETVISKIDHQSLANSNGVIGEVLDASLNYETLPQKGLLNESIILDARLRDVLKVNSSFSIEIENPDSTKTTINNLNSAYTWTPTSLGVYRITYKTVGYNDVVVTSEPMSVTIKDKITLPTIILSGEYASTYQLDHSLTILDATFSDDALSDTYTIKLIKPGQGAVVVSQGSIVTLDVPGIYTLTYEVSDGANPEPNKVVKTYSINVPDLIKPIISFDLQETATVGDTINKPEFTITDASETDVTIIIEKPDGTTFTLTDDNFVVDQTGNWKVSVTAVDLYENSETLTKTIVVSSPKGINKVLAISLGSAGGVSVIAAVIFAVIKFRKKV